MRQTWVRLRASENPDDERGQRLGGGHPALADDAQHPAAPLEDYVADRSAGPLFVNREGTARLSYSTSYALIRRLARRAGIAAADRLSPHSLPPKESYRATETVQEVSQSIASRLMRSG